MEYSLQAEDDITEYKEFLMAKLHGVFVVMTTPFNEDGSINYDGAKSNIEWYIKSGAHGLLPLGATGEFASFSTEERKEFASFVMKTVAGRIPVCIGAVSQNVATTLEICEHAAQIGADGVMCLVPPGLHLNQEEAYAYFKTISDNVSLPVMVYNNPGSAGVDVEFETLERIVELPHMDYLKESTGDIKRLSLIKDKLEDKVTVFCGWEDMAYESFVMGAEGWVAVLANIAPAMSSKLFDLVTKDKDYDAAWSLYRKVLPLLRYIEGSGKLWQVTKYAMDLQGQYGGPCRAPRLPLTPEEQEDIKAILAANPLN